VDSLVVHHQTLSAQQAMDDAPAQAGVLGGCVAEPTAQFHRLDGHDLGRMTLGAAALAH
jgi:hypothetical protein